MNLTHLSARSAAQASEIAAAAQSQPVPPFRRTATEAAQLAPTPLCPFLERVAGEISKFSRQTERFPTNTYREIFADFLRLRHLMEPKRQKKAIDTLLACILLKELAPRFAALKNRGERIEKITRLCGLRADSRLFPGDDARVEKELIRQAKMLPIAYRCAQQTRSVLTFFTIALTAGESLHHRLTNLANFTRDKQRLIDAMPTQQLFRANIQKLIGVLRSLHATKPLSREAVRAFLEKSDFFQYEWYILVKTDCLDALYARARA